jgi:hypothetical protein
MFRNAKVRILFDTAKSFLTGGSRSLFFFSCSLRSRDLVDLVDYFLSGIFFSGCGAGLDLVDFIRYR